MTSIWKTYTAAPHRMFFLPGALQTVAAMLWWLVDLEGRYGALSFAGGNLLPSPAIHAWLILYGCLPFFIFGFALTAVPNWLSGAGVPRSVYIPAALAMTVGAALFYPALALGEPWLAAAVGLHAVGWAAGWLFLARLVVVSQAQDKHHARVIATALGLGAVGDFAFAAWFAGAGYGALAFALSAALWWFLLPVFLSVCHRMIPWFTGRVVSNYIVIRPYALLWVWLVACLAHGSLEMAGRGELTWIADLPIAAVALYFTSRWGIALTFGNRLLAMLHVAFLWVSIAALLYAAGSLALLLDLPWSPGRAPLHGLGIGFFGAMAIAMTSRVSLGHSGRPLVADHVTWWLFWGVQATAAGRMLIDLLPGSSPRLYTIAALGWLICFGIWAAKYVPLYWRAREDGKAG